MITRAPRFRPEPPAPCARADGRHSREPDARGAYAGMVGYFGFDGAMDTCLAIRTMVGRGRTVSVQAGAGIVADSDPATEFQETVNKASAMLRAIDIAETNS